MYVEVNKYSVNLCCSKLTCAVMLPYKFCLQFLIKTVKMNLDYCISFDQDNTVYSYIHFNYWFILTIQSYYFIHSENHFNLFALYLSCFFIFVILRLIYSYRFLFIYNLLFRTNTHFLLLVWFIGLFLQNHIFCNLFI